MNYIAYILKFILRIKWWLIICPLLVAAGIYFKMKGGTHLYQSSTTIYTGIVSGYDIESTGGTRQDWNIINNAMDNLINIIQSKTTLKNVAMRLYAQGLVHADPEQDNNYLTAQSSRKLINNTPDNVRALIDTSRVDSVAERRTLENLYRFEEPYQLNHVYGMFLYEHAHYSYMALRNIKVRRVGSSDMLEITYENNDPGIVYNTLLTLNDEFVKQYKALRFGETNNVIGYFEHELEVVSRRLRILEDSLRDYNIEHKVINYDEQTKHITALSRDHELRYEEILLNLESSQKLRETLEAQIDGIQTFRNNTAFINKLNEISGLYSRISAAEVFLGNSASKDSLQGDRRPVATSRENLPKLQQQLDQGTRDLQNITQEITNQQYTKEGISTPSMIIQWLEAVLRNEKSKAELMVMKVRREELDEKFVYYSPVGSTLKRKNRAINFSERSYLATLEALNTARLRQKNLQMASATLKILNPPVYPITTLPSKLRLMVAAGTGITFIFILGFFILLEILDRTLRDKIRTERIVGSKVLAAFPRPGQLSERRFAKSHREIASKYLGNAVLNYFHSASGPNIVNIISTRSGDGKTTILENLAAHFTEMGMSVRTLSWNSDFNPEHKEFLLAEQLSDFAKEGPGLVPLSQADVILVEYPAFEACSTPKALLHNASINLLVTSANRTWRDTDQLLFDKTRELTAPAPLTICLNYASREVVEGFVGLLPPQTWLRRLTYQLEQFGFTASK